MDTDKLSARRKMGFRDVNRLLSLESGEWRYSRMSETSKAANLYLFLRKSTPRRQVKLMKMR